MSHVLKINNIISSIDVNLCIQDRQFESKPKWQSATCVMISNYKQKLDQLLRIMNVPGDITSCYDLKCNNNIVFIGSFYDDIVYAMINAARNSISYTKPYIISIVLQGMVGMIK